jgi:hypothetical protein
VNRFKAAQFIRHDLLHDLNSEAVPPASVQQEVRRALAPASEMEVVAHHRASDSEAAHQNVGDELLGRQLRQFRAEREHNHPVEAQPGKRAGLGGFRGEAMHHRPAREEIGRVRLECQHGAGAAEVAGDSRGAGRNRLVAAVHAVEIADGHHCALEARRRRRRIARNDETAACGGKIGAHVAWKPHHTSAGMAATRRTPVFSSRRPMAAMSRSPRARNPP